MIFKTASTIIIVFISISSYLLDKSSNFYIMIAAGVVFIMSIMLEKRPLQLLTLQLVSLFIFHWFSQLNWCNALYLLLVANASIWSGLIRSSVIALLSTSIYSFTRLSYAPSSLYNYLVTGIDLLSYLIMVFLVHYVYNAKKEKEKLNQEKHFLSTHDSLTGLMNFEEFHNRLEQMLTKESKILLTIIDCTDLKSMNDEHGFQSGNRILINVAELLKKIFVNAQLIARYGGDEFAIAMKIDEEENSLNSLTKLIDDEMVKLLGIQVTYGYALYPDDGLSKNSLISAAENSLFSMKREIWLKREENMFRSEKLRMVGELAAGMAHEIRNPLTTIKGFLQISKSNEYNIHPWYDLIMDEITRMSELTAEFLQFSKPHAVNIKEQSIQECIQRVIHLMGPRAVLLGHQLYFDDSINTSYVMMDKDKIVQVLLNIVQNALEAMDISGVVYISLSEQNNYAVIEILDTGTGILDSKLEEIFTPFYTTKETGIGLGLSICQKAIQDHGGMMEVSSTSDLGTTFRITLPLVKITAASYTM